jgi:hypothetical protein
MRNFKNVTKKISLASIGLYNLLGSALAATPTPAASDTTIDTSNMKSPETMIGNFIGLMVSILTMAGVAVLVWGIFELGMSFLHHDPSQRTESFKWMAAGAIICGIRVVLALFGVNIS